MTVSGTTLSMVRGDDETITVTINGYTLTDNSDIIAFGVKEDVDDEEYIIHKSVTEFTDNKAYINIEHDDTKNVEFGTYFYDVQIKFPSGKIRTLVKSSKFKITDEVVTDG